MGNQIREAKQHGIFIGSGRDIVCSANVMENADLMDRTGNVKAAETVAGDGESLAELMTVVPLSQEWRFRTDPGDEGVQERWFATDLADDDWDMIRSDRDCGWESQGFGGENGNTYTGYAWYRVRLPQLPDRLRSFMYLYFDAVDE